MEYNLETVTESFEKYKHLRFPLKIWILVNANGNSFLQWDETKTVVVVDRDGLERYLESAGSIFRCTKMSTFFWMMDFHGFVTVVEKTLNVEDDEKSTPILQYKNSSFSADNRSYFEQLLRSRKLREVASQHNGNCSVHQARILSKQKPNSEPAGALPPLIPNGPQSGSFAQEKFDLLMEMKSLELAIREAYGNLNVDGDVMMPVIEVPVMYCDEATNCTPEYVKKRELAGNYGDVSVEELNRFFGNYRPVFEDSPEATSTTEISHEEPEEVSVPSPEPVNTLETFDYQEDEDDVVDVEDENSNPVNDSGIGEQFPLESKNEKSALVDGEVMMSSACKDDSGYDDQSSGEQFQLCADIRETFELLNQF